MVTRLSTNSVMVRDKVAQLPSYLVRQWRLATKHKTDSLWLRRGRTQAGPVLLQEKSIQTNIPLSAFCPLLQYPIRKSSLPYRNYPDTCSPLANPKISLLPPITTLCQCWFSGKHLFVSLFEEGSFQLLLSISTFMGQKR